MGSLPPLINMIQPQYPLQHCVNECGLNHRRKQMHAVKETIHSQLLPLPLHERGAAEMLSLFGSKCMRGRLRFVHGYCQQTYAYSC